MAVAADSISRPEVTFIKVRVEKSPNLYFRTTSIQKKVGIQQRAYSQLYVIDVDKSHTL